MSVFEKWWAEDGSAIRPICDDDPSETTKRVAEMAFAVSEDFYRSLIIRLLGDIAEIMPDSIECDDGSGVDKIFVDYVPLSDVEMVINKYKGFTA